MALESKNPAAILIKELGVIGMAQNIENVLAEAVDFAPDLFKAGVNWYNNGRILAMDYTDEGRMTACGIVAALSPQTSWSQNLKNAQTFVRTGHAPTFGTNVSKARKILEGVHPLNVLGGNKVRSFYNNLFDPGNAEHVTVDRHAVNIALGSNMDGSAKALELAGNYKTIVDAYSLAGESFGILPNQAQAASWLAWRSIHAPAYAMADPDIEA